MVDRDMATIRETANRRANKNAAIVREKIGLRMEDRAANASQP